MEDLVSYTVKRNWANGEDNRDGHSENHSDNLGVEGPTTETGVLAARALRKRNLMATLVLSQGVPMILAGDELGHTQGGNNNAYDQDNAMTWLEWDSADPALARFIARLAAIRREAPILRQRRFLHARARAQDGLRDVIWHRPDGREPSPLDWHDPAFRCLCVELRHAAEGERPDEDALFAVFNCGPAVPLALPATAPGWRLILDTTRPDLTEGPAPAEAPAESVLLLRAVPAPDKGEDQ